MKIRFIVLNTPGFTAKNIFFAGDITDHGWHKWLQDVNLEKKYLGKQNDWRFKEAEGKDYWYIDFEIKKSGKSEFKFIGHIEKNGKYETFWFPKDKNLLIEIPDDIKNDELLLHIFAPFTPEFANQNLLLYGSFNDWKANESFD